jgi:hypothetical protein
VYYKIVRMVCGNKVSFNTNPCSLEPSTVIYKEGVKALPSIPNSKLYIFDSLDKAVKYYHNMCCDQRHEIWECEAENPEPGLIMIGDAHLLQGFWTAINSRDYQLFGESILYDGYIYQLQMVPGTVWCDSVTLIKKVYPGSMG